MNCCVKGKPLARRDAPYLREPVETGTGVVDVCLLHPAEQKRIDSEIQWNQNRQKREGNNNPQDVWSRSFGESIWRRKSSDSSLESTCGDTCVAWSAVCKLSARGVPSAGTGETI